MELLKELGAIAGIGGIALGVFFLLFRDVIAKSIFSNLPSAESYKLMRLIIICVWSVAIIGMILWFTNGLKLVIGNGNIFG
jgi:hypothetical protein